MNIDASAASRGTAPPRASTLLEPIGAAILAALSLTLAAILAALVADGGGLLGLIVVAAYGALLVVAPRALYRGSRGAPALRAVAMGVMRAHRALALAHVIFLGALGVAAFAVASDGLAPAQAAATVASYAGSATVATLVVVAGGVLFPGALFLMGRPVRWRGLWAPLAAVSVVVVYPVSDLLLGVASGLGRGEPVMTWVLATGLATGALSIAGAAAWRALMPRPFVAIDVDRDGARAVAARRGGAWLIDLTTGARVAALRDGAAVVRFSPDGALVAMDAGPGELALRRGRDGALVAALGGAPDDVRALAFDAAGTRLAASSDAAEVVVWDLATGAATRYDAPLAYVTTVAFAAAGDELVVATAAGLTGRVPLGAGGGVARTLRNGAASPSAARATLAADGGRIVWAHGKAPLTDHVALHELRGAAAPALRWSQTLPDAVRAACFGSNGALIAAVTVRADVRVFDAATGAPVAARDALGDAIGAIAVHGASEQVVVAGRWTVRAWSWRSDVVRGLAGTEAALPAGPRRAPTAGLAA